jgi:hypothetical protein
MDAIEFVNKYEDFVSEIALVVKPEYVNILIEMKKRDPHDLVTPQTWFPNEATAKGVIWQIFLNKVKKLPIK